MKSKFIVLYWSKPSQDCDPPSDIFGRFPSIKLADEYGEKELPDEGEYMVLPMVITDPDSIVVDLKNLQGISYTEVES